ncbi:MAG: 30S ribosomal protein S1 [Fimbriimonadales bacterium]
MSDDRKAPSGEMEEPTEGDARTATATEPGGPRPVEEGPIAASVEPQTAEAPTQEPEAETPTDIEPAESVPVAEEAAPTEQMGDSLPEQIAEVAAEPAPEPSPQAVEPAPEAPPERSVEHAPELPLEMAVESAPVSQPAPKRDLDAAAEFEAALEAFEGGTTGTSYDDAFRPLSRGELLTARVIQVDKDKVFVDLGTKSEGVVPIDELSASAFENASDVVKVGDEIKVVVLNPEGREGNPIVSRKRAEFESAWDRIIEEFEKKITITAIVSERVKGGLVVDLGVRGFVPATHVGSGQIRNLDKFVGQSLPFKIIEVDRDRRKVVLSNRLAEEETREERKQQIFESVKPGDILDGHVRRLADYGAFVDLGGVDGLLHVSEMSWSRVDHPKEVMKEGDEVKVMVLRLDPASGRISLGRRQVLPDPWTSIRENYTVGKRLTLPISRVVQSGAFVKLPEGAEAFIPISEMAHRRINKPSEVVSPGQDVDIQVIDLRPDERRLVLSMRALLPYEERPSGGHSEEAKHRSDRSRDRRGGSERSESRGHQSAPTGNLTIGERLSALKGLTFGDDDETAGAQAPPIEEKVEAEEAVVAEASPEAKSVEAPEAETTEAETPESEVAETPAEKKPEEKPEEKLEE